MRQLALSAQRGTLWRLVSLMQQVDDDHMPVRINFQTGVVPCSCPPRT